MDWEWRWRGFAGFCRQFSEGGDMFCFFAASLLITTVFIYLFIHKLCKVKFFRKEVGVDGIKKDCMRVLHQHKMGTPSMGGIAICIALMVCTIGYAVVTGRVLWIHLLLLLFGGMGFLDDYIKLKDLRDGMNSKQKMTGLLIVTGILLAFLLGTGQIAETIRIPFVAGELYLGVPAMAGLMGFVILASGNSMNLTDGIDGLAAGISAIIFVFIGVTAYQQGNQEVLFGAVVMEAACLGFLLFNLHPASIFMGDTGSLLLGGTIAVFLIQLEIPLWICLVMLVCVFETISVILQIFSIRVFQCRVFKIAPFHHHLEKCGWKETGIAAVGWLVTIAACIVGYMGL